MNPADREQVRLCLIRHLVPANRLRKYGLSTELLHQQLRADGLSCDRTETELEIVYLLGKGLVEKIPKVISPEQQQWKLSAAGRDYAAEQDLE